MATTGALAAACLGARDATGLLLGAYAVGWAQVVAVAFLLSPPGLVTRGWLAAGLALSAAAVGVVWHLRGWPRPPSLRPAARAAREELRDPLLAVLAAVVALGGLYVVGLAFFTPALEWDSLAYHLPRAAFWVQQQAIGYVPNASDTRLDGNPPGAEIGILATMLLSGSDRFVALPQLLALGALVVAIGGIARRVGLTRRQALLGSLLFAGLPLVAIQAPTTYNDLVVASFLVVCAYAVLGRARYDLALVAFSLAMALTTKLTAVITLPLLALVALVGAPRRRLPAIAAAALAGLAGGATWYVVNLVETGHADGGLAGDTAQRQDLSLAAIAPTIRRYVYSFVDFSGSRDVGVFTLYGALALGILVLGVAVGWARGRTRRAVVLSLGAAATVALPLLLVEIARGGIHAWFKLWLVLGREDIARSAASWQLQVGSDAALSWYGPVGAALLVLGTAIVGVAVARRRLPAVAALLALAPIVFVVVFAFAAPWDPWRGRFAMAAVALAAAVWGLALEVRPVAWGAVALTAVALPLALLGMYTKPSSAPFVHGYDGPSIWTDSWEVVLDDLAESDGVVTTSAAIRRGEHGAVALAARENDFLYLFFGSRDPNEVRLVPIDGGRVPPDATWLVLSPGSRVERCGTWRVVAEEEGWQASRRVPGSTGGCETVSARTT